MANYAVVHFTGKGGTKKVVPIRLVRSNEDGQVFAPNCIQDIPEDNVDVKWQKSDLEAGSDGYFPAKIICLGSK